MVNTGLNTGATPRSFCPGGAAKAAASPLLCVLGLQRAISGPPVGFPTYVELCWDVAGSRAVQGWHFLVLVLRMGVRSSWLPRHSQKCLVWFSNQTLQQV